eukprot:TRINITY_DN54474_c0_g1_i1.p1 TRINITY_DN54474_c0_g1~~TRINITY_DN54474_c0_g1_i1.p1  ORF type:complete len:719 (-),score=106.66 TRINITY_DN54474_c0_g1_i1:281-2437(-)
MAGAIPGLELPLRPMATSAFGAGPLGIPLPLEVPPLAQMPLLGVGRGQAIGSPPKVTEPSSVNAPAASDEPPHPTLLLIRQGIAANDRDLVVSALATAEKTNVPIEPHVRVMIKQWLGPENPPGGSSTPAGSSLGVSLPGISSLSSSAPAMSPPGASFPALLTSGNSLLGSSGSVSAPVPCGAVSPVGVPAVPAVVGVGGVPPVPSIAGLPGCGGLLGIPSLPSPLPGIMAPAIGAGNLLLPSEGAQPARMPGVGALPVSLPGVASQISRPALPPGPLVVPGAPTPLTAGTMVPCGTSHALSVTRPPMPPAAGAGGLLSPLAPTQAPSSSTMSTTPQGVLHPSLIMIRNGIAAQDREAVKVAVAAAEQANVQIEPHVRSMLQQWLGQASLAPQPHSAPSTGALAAPTPESTVGNSSATTVNASISPTSTQPGPAVTPHGTSPTTAQAAVAPVVQAASTPAPAAPGTKAVENSQKASTPPKKWDGTSGVISSQPKKSATALASDDDSMSAMLAELHGMVEGGDTAEPPLSESKEHDPTDAAGVTPGPGNAGSPGKVAASSNSPGEPPSPKEAPPPPPPEEAPLPPGIPPDDVPAKRPAGRGRGRAQPLPPSEPAPRPAGRGRGRGQPPSLQAASLSAATDSSPTLPTPATAPPLPAGSPAPPPVDEKAPEPPAKRRHLTWGAEEEKEKAPQAKGDAREAWEYLKKDDFGSGNFFDFSKF